MTAARARYAAHLEAEKTDLAHSPYWRKDFYAPSDGAIDSGAKAADAHTIARDAVAALVVQPTLEACKLAQEFHETYERLAPSFGYETRNESAKPWADVPDKNKALMTAVCSEIIKSGVMDDCLTLAQLVAENERLRTAMSGETEDRMAELVLYVARMNELAALRSSYAAMVERLLGTIAFWEDDSCRSLCTKLRSILAEPQAATESKGDA